MINRSLFLRALFTAFVVLSGLLDPSPVSAQRGARTDASHSNRVVSIGRLIRSGTARNGTPRFALLDDEGSVTAYVAPASGVSLVRHLNQHVAVTARSVSRDGNGLPYLLAQRVAVIQDEGEAEGQLDELDTNEWDADEPRIVTDSGDTDSSLDTLIADGADARFGNAESGQELAWGAGVRRDSAVRPAGYTAEELIEPAEILPESQEGMMLDNYGASGGSCGDPNCSSCAPCGPCTNSCCPCGPAGRYWFRVDFLSWATKSMDTPPLVTTSPSGTAAQDAGVLGVDGTQVISGGADSDSLSRNGVRFVLGGWLDACQHRGIEFDYYFLDQETDNFSRSSFGDPILARPFFNTQLNMQDSELVAYPGIVSGTVAVNYESELQSFTPRYRHNLRCTNFAPMSWGGCGDCGPDPCGMSCGPIGGSRVDLTVGYRYLRLNEGLRISEDLISETGDTFATFNLSDHFDTTNEFSGLELGLVWDRYQGRWSFEAAGRFAMGNNKRSVAINGSTTSVIQGAVFQDVGGLLALPSNIGTYDDDQFVVIPELSLTLGYQIAPRMRVLVGYTMLYWNNVVRPGDQIDLNVNPDLLPPAMDTDGMLLPAFAMNDTTFWAQGLNLGLDWRW